MTVKGCAITDSHAESLQPSAARVLRSSCSNTSPMTGTRTSSEQITVLHDLLELSKVRLNAMVLVTTLVGYWLAHSGSVDGWHFFHTGCGVFLAAIGSAAWNQYLERDLDRLMHRTSDRPLVTGRVSARTAMVFGTSCIAIGLFQLALLVGGWACFFCGLTVFVYLACYTPLKRRSPWCTVVGAVSGALPPVIGWVAAGGSWSITILILFGILFFWQLPHFIAICWIYRDDYRRAGMPMISVIDPQGRWVGRCACICIAILAAISVLPGILTHLSFVYWTGAMLLGAAFAISGISFAKALSDRHARWMLYISLAYLPLLLALWTLEG